MGLSNDQRGWLFTGLSSIACLVGALLICVDIIVRLFPKGKSFRIQDSNVFLSSALSLSAGVMLFSALFNMLPSSKSSLQKTDLSSRAVAWIMIACFLGGIVAIGALSRVFHHLIPSQVVDCDHTHENGEAHPNDTHRDHDSPGHSHQEVGQMKNHGHTSEITPLLSSNHRASTDKLERSAYERSNTDSANEVSLLDHSAQYRVSLPRRVTSTVSQLVSGAKVPCDNDGPCYGYTDLRGQDCFKNTSTRRSSKTRGATTTSGRPDLCGQVSAASVHRSSMQTPVVHPDDQEAVLAGAKNRIIKTENSESIEPGVLHKVSTDYPGMRRQSTYRTAVESRFDAGSHSTSLTQDSSLSPHGSLNQRSARHESEQSGNTTAANTQDEVRGAVSTFHHHHVPTNAFLTLSLQTSIAIALHKLPEGFITYATNHASPSLGFSVFLALFIHNITEGFALSLPLYLATNSRVKALVYTLFLGGLSQPIGAGVAAVWLNISERGRGDFAPGNMAYGIMFGLTSGIMAAVGISLLQEALGLSHNRKASSNWVFVGMGVLGISGALTS